MVLLITRAMLHLTFILHSFLLTPRISFLVIGSNFGSAEVRKVSYRISHVHFNGHHFETVHYSLDMSHSFCY